MLIGIGHDNHSTANRASAQCTYMSVVIHDTFTPLIHTRAGEIGNHHDSVVIQVGLISRLQWDLPLPNAGSSSESTRLSSIETEPSAFRIQYRLYLSDNQMT